GTAALAAALHQYAVPARHPAHRGNRPGAADARSRSRADAAGGGASGAEPSGARAGADDGDRPGQLVERNGTDATLAVAGAGRRAFDRPGYPRCSWRLVARASGRAGSAAAYRYLGADLSARAIAGGSGAGAGQNVQARLLEPTIQVPLYALERIQESTAPAQVALLEQLRQQAGMLMKAVVS